MQAIKDRMEMWLLFPLIFAAAGHPNSIFEITYKKLVNITNGLEKDVSE